MDERARQILDEAWANVERIEKMEVREPTYAPPEREPIVRRTRGLDTTPVQNYTPDADAWNAWFVQQFTQLFEQHMAEFSDCVVEIVFTRMDKQRKELEAEIVALRQELTLLREVRNGVVLELRKHDVA